VLGILALAAACESTPPPLEPLDGLAFTAAPGIPLNATVDFGAPAGAHGTNFPPASHDASFHSYDKMFPRTVNIAAGGSVTFNVESIHQVAVYDDGTRPGHIDLSQTEPIPVLPVLDRITDANNRLALGPDQAFGPYSWTTPPGTFAQPGRYLVICTTLVHFVFANMYAWVIVH
jgi:plastocyanin